MATAQDLAHQVAGGAEARESMKYWLKHRNSVYAGASIWPELLAIGALLVLPWIGIAVAVNYVYDHNKAAAVQTTANLAQALEESTRRTVGAIDSVLLGARAMHLVQGDRFDLQQWVKLQTLPDAMTAQVGAADRTGLVTASTKPLPPGISIADRPHFLAQIDPAHDHLFISRPVIGRVSGLETIQFSRKLLDQSGAFAGVIVLSLDTIELARFYEGLGLGKGSISILASDGSILSRAPHIATPSGVNMRNLAASQSLLDSDIGSTELPATPQRGGLIASFRHVRDYPLIVMVDLDIDSVLAPYRSLRDGALVGGATITLAIGLIGVFWVRQKRRSLASRHALDVTLETISQGILMVGQQGNVLVINTRLQDLLRRPDEPPDITLQTVASRARDLAASQLATNSEAALKLEADAVFTSVALDYPSDAATVPWRDGRFETFLENGRIIEVRTHALPDAQFVQTYTDVTQQRQAHAQVVHLAHHDALTGLANRVSLMERLSATLDQPHKPSEISALILIDLDGFKGINDSLGHDAGDSVLIEVGSRLTGLVRSVDLVARLGGDEFVILLPTVRQREDIPGLAQRVLQRLAEAMQITGQQVFIGASIGIAFYPSDALDADTWLKHADMALYSAKNGGRGVWRCFDEKLSVAVTEHRQLAGELRQAIERDELEVYFQPKFDCQSLEITGFEALARWRHPIRGFVSPTIFIRIAEDCGLVSQLGLSILRETCRRIADWDVRYPVAVNVSVMQLRDSQLKDYIATVLDETGLRPEHLEIEVTESVMADEDPVILANLEAIKAMGLAIALDDFGTGYSSLSHLQRFVFDKIKIDRSFVQGQAENLTVRVILQAILGMCHNLAIATVGEGVETAEELAMLRNFGCTEVQGYLLGRPMPHDQVQDFIRSNHVPYGLVSQVSLESHVALAS